MSPLSQLGTRGRRSLVTIMALGVLWFAVCGLVASAVATGHDLPGFALYDVAREDEPAAEAVSVAPLARFTSPVEAITIPAIKINAPLVPLGVRPDGYMDLPFSPHQVAWYDFTAKPGSGGNAVFSAHVDYINYGPAVFWNLSKLRPGDAVAIKLKDGVVLHYSVAVIYQIAVDELDIHGLIAPTDAETMTLITCGGAYSNKNYSHRVIVRATRI
ncbi:MAG: class F sortase [Dehalococcoidia bacterium]|nr:class F sortase [Dehalococcoidia bacterium]